MATPTGLLEKANDVQVTLQGDASLEGASTADVEYGFTTLAGSYEIGAPT